MSEQDTDEGRWLAALREQRAAGAHAVATLDDVERLISERDEARAELTQVSERADHLREYIAKIDLAAGSVLEDAGTLESVQRVAAERDEARAALAGLREVAEGLLDRLIDSVDQKDGS